MRNVSFREKVQHKYALSEQGAREMIKAFISVTISDIVLMFPVGLLYYLGAEYEPLSVDVNLSNTLFCLYFVQLRIAKVNVN